MEVPSNNSDNTVNPEKTAMDLLFEEIEKEKDEIFKNTWAKLDKGLKLNRIHLFIKKEKINLELNDNEEKQLKNLLLNLLNSGSLNKSSEIEYCQEEYGIKTVKNLNFDEETRNFSYLNQKKKKSENGGSKSKTNVEKHFNRSKDNRK